MHVSKQTQVTSFYGKPELPYVVICYYVMWFHRYVIRFRHNVISWLRVVVSSLCDTVLLFGCVEIPGSLKFTHNFPEISH